MRTIGALLVLAGIVGFFYCSSQLVGPGVDTRGHVAGATTSNTTPASSSSGRYLSLVAAFIGVLCRSSPRAADPSIRARTLDQ